VSLTIVVSMRTLLMDKRNVREIIFLTLSLTLTLLLGETVGYLSMW